MTKQEPKILFLIEDGPYLYDNRVRREALCLHQAGAQVSVICPNAGTEPARSIVDGVHIYRYRKPGLGEGLLAHIGEYFVSLVSQFFLSLVVAFRNGFSVIHAANPPDLLWLVALPYRLFGVRFVFDHHDLVPELFEERFGSHRKTLLAIARFMERMSFRLASHVISTNESYRQVAIARGAKKENEVTVVRNGPDPADFPDTPPDVKIRNMAPTIVGYLGNMNPQDGVDYVLQAAAIIRNELKRTDIGFVLIGSGDSFDSLTTLRDELGLGENVVMTGRIPWTDVVATLSAIDIGVQPDPPGGLNDHSTMNKLMDYMILGKAVVAFDLPETRVSGGDAIVYADGDSAMALVEAIIGLADDREKLREFGENARLRVAEKLSWQHQSPNLVSVYQQLFPNSALGPQDLTRKELKTRE
jgi:glycosyltransferase involved in cell wall biosynthesis